MMKSKIICFQILLHLLLMAALQRLNAISVRYVKALLINQHMPQSCFSRDLLVSVNLSLHIQLVTDLTVCTIQKLLYFKFLHLHMC